VTRRLRDESGMTLIAAVLIVFGMLAFGLAMMAAADTQTQTSARERTREASFNLAEASLNAQALQLTRAWPAGDPGVTACTPTTTASMCPTASAIGGGYTEGDYAASPCVTSPATPAWQTSVHDNTGGSSYWSQAVISGNNPRYDANGDGVLWVRSQATAHCHSVAVVSQVSQAQVPIAFPNNVVTANWFETTNQGRKVIVDTLGSGGQPAGVVARCSGLTTAQCLKYDSAKGQVQPPAIRSDSSASASTLSATQLSALEAQAIAAGTYIAGCPTNPATQLSSPASGAPVYVKSCPTGITVGGTTQINSAAKPGALIVESGTITFGGTASFYGLLYMVNKGGVGHPTPVITIGGNAQVYGVVSVDGNGGIRAGSSKTNLINDPRAVSLLKGTSGARLNKNTFRVVPVD
jgi:Tfp pilus assembly protein PilX